MELLKLVIVDDEPILLQGLLDTYDWESMGFEVVGSAKSGVQALEVIRREQPHVVLTDIRMKQMTGLMVMEEIQKEQISCLFVVLSAYRDFEYAKHACDLGAYAYLLKPSDSIKIVQNKDAMYTQIMYDKKDDMKEEAQSWQKVRNMISSLRRTQSGIVWIIRNSHSRKRLKIWESVILRSKHGSGQPRNMKAVCQQEDPAIIPVMRQKRSLVSNES